MADGSADDGSRAAVDRLTAALGRAEAAAARLESRQAALRAAATATADTLDALLASATEPADG